MIILVCTYLIAGLIYHTINLKYNNLECRLINMVLPFKT